MKRRLPSSKPCSVEGCSRPFVAKGLCQTHYMRLRRRGTLELPERRRPVEERLRAKFYEAEDGCWVWTAGTQRGYGSIYVNGQFQKAHRVSYELHRGPIPEGLVIDHLCRNPACVNPDHLEPVTQAENIRRGLWGAKAESRRRKTHCANGHEFTPENTYEEPGVNHRHCRECERQRNRRRQRRAS